MSNMLKKMSKIGILEEGQKYFKDERSFNKYLLSDDGMQILGEKINIELSSPMSEVIVEDNKRIDIIFDSNIEGLKVIVESQLKKSDHDHLGKIVSYSTQNEEYSRIIWIVEEAQGIHINAINELNKAWNTNAVEKKFWLMEMSLIKLDGYDGASLNFEIVASPTIEDVAISNGNEKINETKKARLKFWESFEDWGIANSFKTGKPSTDHWNTFTFNNKLVNVRGGSFTFLVKENEIRTILTFNKKPNNTSDLDEFKKLHDFLEQNINKEEFGNLSWTNDETKKTSSLYVSRKLKDNGIYDENDFEWMLKCKKMFEEQLKNFKGEKSEI